MEHETHPDIVRRLKRASGHLVSVISMIEAGRSCVDLAQQLFAVESAIANAKRELIHDHIEHCLSDGLGTGEVAPDVALVEFKLLAKYL